MPEFNVFNEMNIHQIYISKSLQHFSRIKDLYNLSDYTDLNKPLLIFGMYDSKDYYALKKHNHIVYILWGGSDLDPRIKKSVLLVNKITKLFIIKNVVHIAISVNMAKRMDKFGMIYKIINFTLADPKLFIKTVNPCAYKIYIYNGYSKGKEWIYGKKYYEKIEKKLPEFKYIHSCNLNVSYNEMPSIYSQCFIGVRLTKYDGNANTVQEFNLMDIPIIYNGQDNSVNYIKWDRTRDIINNILHENTKKFISQLKKFHTYILLSLSADACDVYRHIIMHDWMIANGYDVKSYSDNINMVNTYSKYSNYFMPNYEKYNGAYEIYFGMPRKECKILPTNDTKILLSENETQIENINDYSAIFSSNSKCTKKYDAAISPFHCMYLALYDSCIEDVHKKYKYIVICLKFIPLSAHMKNFIKYNKKNNILLVGDNFDDCDKNHKSIYTTDIIQITYWISRSKYFITDCTSCTSIFRTFCLVYNCKITGPRGKKN